MTEPASEKAPPALYRHMLSVWDAMCSQAQVVKVVEGDFETEMLVYEGKLTQLVTKELRIPVPFYSSVTKAFREIGIARQLRRGGGQSESQWELIKAPKIDDFNAWKDNTTEEEADDGGQMLRDLARRVIVIENALGIVP